MQRRDFIKLSALSILPMSLGAYDLDAFLGKNSKQKATEQTVPAAQTTEIIEASGSEERFLWLMRGNEEFKDTFYVNGRYSIGSYKKFCWLMRDLRDDDGFVAIDASIMNLLYKIQNTLVSHGMREPIKINSGYRSLRTNAATEGAAKNSFHTKGKAVDITIAGADANLLGALGVMMQRGGVGFYPNKNFIHLDTGSVRTWSIGSDGIMRGA